MDLNTLDNTLKQLKRDSIYDYESESNYYKIFTSFYEKKEAIDFLIKKKDTDIEKLKDELEEKLGPTNRNISVEDIEDTIECLNEFKDLANKENLEIIQSLQSFNEKKFKNSYVIRKSLAQLLN